MAEIRRRGRRGRTVTAGLAALLALTLAHVVSPVPASAKPGPHSILGGSVLGWLSDRTVWPQRALVLFAPRGATVNASTVGVTEGGASVSDRSVTPLRQARRGDLGLMFVIGQSHSMAGAPLNAALAAVHSLSATALAGGQLGVITFSSQPHLLAPMSSDSAMIARALASAPRAGNGADVPSAIRLGLRQLNDAKVAMGALIVVSDGVGDLTRPGSPVTTVQSAAAAAHVPVFTVGLKDRATSTASLRGLATAAGGQFVASPPGSLAAVFQEISSAVTRGYIVRWRSRAGTARTVAVSATVAGVPGSVQFRYQTPASSSRAEPGSSTPPGQRTHRLPALDNSNTLSRWPSFAALPSAAPAAITRVGSTSLWNTLPGILGVAGTCGLLLTIALAMLFYSPSKRAARTRVGSYSPAVTPEGDELLSAASARGLMQRIERGAWWPAYVENVDIAGGGHSPIALVKRAAALGLVLSVAVTLASGSILLALIPLLLWPFALRKVIGRSAGKQREKFRDTLPGYLQDLASALRVGRSFVGGLSAVVETADEPVRGAFQRAVVDESFGRPIEEALEAVAERMQAPDLLQVALIAGLNRRSGSNVSEALDRVAEGSRENASLRREVKALTGQARMSSWVLTGLPAVLLLAMSIMSPAYAKPLLHTTMGIVLLAVGATMVYAGFRVMKKITDVEP